MNNNLSKIKPKRVKKDKYVILFPKLHYPEAACITMMTPMYRPVFVKLLHNKRNVCGGGFDNTIYLFNVEVFFTHRNAKLIDDRYFWLYYMEV